MDPSETVAKVGLVDGPHVLNLSAERVEQGGRQERGPVFPPLAVPDDDVTLVEVDIPDPEPEVFHEPESGPGLQAGGEPGTALKLSEDGTGLLATENGRQPLGHPGPHDVVVKPGQGPLLDDLVEEEQSAEGLILRRGGNRLSTPPGGSGRPRPPARPSRADAACPGRG